MELYRAIVKLEQGGSTDLQVNSRSTSVDEFLLLILSYFWIFLFQERADKVQSDLDELVKALNERCKKYGLRGKPLTLTELPFGEIYCKWFIKI